MNDQCHLCTTDQTYICGVFSFFVSSVLANVSVYFSCFSVVKISASSAALSVAFLSVFSGREAARTERKALINVGCYWIRRTITIHHKRPWAIVMCRLQLRCFGALVNCRNGGTVLPLSLCIAIRLEPQINCRLYCVG